MLQVPRIMCGDAPKEQMKLARREVFMMSVQFRMICRPMLSDINPTDETSASNKSHMWDYVGRRIQSWQIDWQSNWPCSSVKDGESSHISNSPAKLACLIQRFIAWNWESRT